MRKSPFVVAIPVILTILALSLTAILRPDWYGLLIVSTPPSPSPDPILRRQVEYGLWRKCTKITKRHTSNSFLPSDRLLVSVLGKDGGEGEGGKHEGGRANPDEGSGEDPLRLGRWVCEPFPQDKGSFAILWSTAGYLAIVSLIPHLASCVALFIIAIGLGERQVRKARRKRGWKGVAACSLVAGVLQAISFGIVAHVFRTAGRHFERLDGASAHLHTSTILFAISAVLSILLFVALTYTGFQARAGKVWAGGMSVRGKGKGRRSRSSHGRRSSPRALVGQGMSENAPLLEETPAAEEA